MTKNEFLKKIILYRYTFILVAMLLIIIGSIILGLVMANKNVVSYTAKATEVLPTPNATVIMPEKQTYESFGNISMWESDELVEPEESEELEEFYQQIEEAEKEYDYENPNFVKKLVVIDAGHGGFDSGAIGSFSGVHEDDINLTVALKLEKLFIDNGYDTVMTRSDEKAVGSTKLGDMHIRRAIIEKANSQLTISIHMNFFTDASASGPQVFYCENSKKGKTAAQLIQDNLDKYLNPPKKREIAQERYYILRSGASPSALVECGFLSNKNEEYLLRQESYQDKIALAIYNGAHAYLQSENNS